MKQLFLVVALMWTSMASANIIEISTDEVNVVAGNEVNYSIRLVDFEEFDFLTFSLNFDDVLLSFNSSSISSDFAIVDFFTTFDGLDVFEDASTLFFTLNSDFMMGETFAGSYLLASFSFDANANGVALFGGEFSAIDSLSLNFTEITPPSFTVASSATVSEPSTIALFAGLLMAGLVARRKVF
ncbi:PEP-CTERM sorting domain-containing protein [Alteromonas oceanisediminis]|uniref:PEP-CTERM sorting domain-containing protein n=1 Tax=Alteromonas oceanisediminis TaxID=2836180 RepID=UPI001BD9B91A|nr:PEP-CTERM sorting domain-containing protein [Alteromonas oceanisediminis]MBT0585316.1 PEP-CTERM sorting domain-containing protein [Alteromonas oceanisediminis]